MSIALPQTAPETRTDSTTTALRLWPGLLIVAALGLSRVWATLGEPAPTKFFFGLLICPVIAVLLRNLWWLFASRIRWSDR